MAENMKWVRYGLQETASKGRRECIDLCRIDVSEELGRYRPSETDARLLRSDRAWLERYVATERDGRYVAWLEVGRYVATERVVCSVATWRPSLARARSLRSDRETFFGLFSDVSCFFRTAFLWPLELGRVLLLPLIPENNLKDQVKLEIRVSRRVNGSLDGSTKEMIGWEI
ncbi:hypothetical protein F2Q69_00006987 [Brassica cretica]|uniref:Uncharacterized protein n=1 Tax=Brassica cretica TaxID=69181 RepID=A0A8S9PD82_BRACR|nr:hypothetical protein F2Q69_00006987 [Brassica cretica]